MRKKSQSQPADQPTSWDSDRVKDKTSFEVLLDWFSKPQNYARWKSAHRGGTISKARLCEEINRRMHKQDITCRSDGGIQRKVYQVFKCMASANELLKENGMKPQVSLGECEESLKREILRLCPYFEILAPVMNESLERVLSKRSARLSQEEIRQRLAREEEIVLESQVTGDCDDLTEDKEDEQHLNRARSNSHTANQNSDSESDSSSRVSPETVEAETESTGNKRKNSRNPWIGDHEGISSLDVLLNWLGTGNNYSRWRRMYSKVALCNEINDLLHAQGIYSRSNEDIRNKVNRLVKSVAKAKTLLQNQDVEGRRSLNDCDEKLGKDILRACPHFESLSHVVVGTSESEIDIETTQAALNDEEEKDEDAGFHGEELEDQEDQGFAPEAEDHEDEAFASEEEEAVVNEQEDEVPAHQEIDEEDARVPTQTPTKPMAVHVSDFKLSPLQQRQLEQRCAEMEFSHQRASIQLENLREKGRVELETMRERGEFELASARKKREIELKAAETQTVLEIKRQKCDLENVRERNEFSLLVERELSRQKLRSAGISQAEVDRLLPSKQLGLL